MGYEERAWILAGYYLKSEERNSFWWWLCGLLWGRLGFEALWAAKYPGWDTEPIQGNPKTPKRATAKQRNVGIVMRGNPDSRQDYERG
jgi:hypothetical protein